MPVRQVRQVRQVGQVGQVGLVRRLDDAPPHPRPLCLNSLSGHHVQLPPHRASTPCWWRAHLRWRQPTGLRAQHHHHPAFRHRAPSSMPITPPSSCPICSSPSWPAGRWPRPSSPSSPISWPHDDRAGRLATGQRHHQSGGADRGGFGDAGRALLRPGWCAYLIAPGFDAAQQAETVNLMRLVLISTLFFGDQLGAEQRAARLQALPASRPSPPVVYPLGITSGALWLAPDVGRAGPGGGRGDRRSSCIWPSKIPGLIHFGFRW